MIYLQAKGSTRLAAPTCTAVAPANIISITSSAEDTPPHAHYGDFDSVGYLVDHAHGYGEDCRTGESAHFVGNDGLFGLQINAHSQKGVDQADAVGSRFFAGLCDGNNIGNIGGKFDNNGFCGDGLNGFGHFCRRFGGGSEGHASAVDVGAGHVDLQPAHLVAFVQLFAGGGVIGDGKSADVGHDGLMKTFCKLGQFFADHLIHAGVLKTDGVDHACGAFGNAGGGVAEAGLQGGSLEGEGPQNVDIVQFGKFIAEAEGSAGGDDRVVHLNAAEGDFCIHHMISSFSSTGPSLQIRLFPYLVLQEHPMQAPNPHPMRSSKLN